MMRQGWGRIVNVTTSLGAMLNAGCPTYGPSKAALEAPSAIMAKDLDGSKVTVNVLFPGGITNTPQACQPGRRETGADTRECRQSLASGNRCQSSVSTAPAHTPLTLTGRSSAAKLFTMPSMPPSTPA